MSDHCCDPMRKHVELTCERHEFGADCPDSVIAYHPGSGGYGLRIHDGGASYYVIDYCPWCGIRLGEKKSAYDEAHDPVTDVPGVLRAAGVEPYDVGWLP